ncbi:MAG: tetratricopeptide repeat protein [Alphaproteobacteria bacterium]|nr:tetratricopeptide repeat protein [Alphaproteobacteria bacterium]
MVDSNESFLREVKEEMERERLENLWKRYGTLVIGAGVVLVAAVAGLQIWTSMAKSAAEKAGSQYQAALDSVFDKKLDDAASAFETLSKSAPDGYGSLAQLQLAATHMEQDKPAEALKVFEALATSSTADKLFKDFASLQAAALRVGDGDWTEIKNRLNDLTKDANPWRYNAQELLGVAALKAGKLSEAREAFEKLLGDSNVPPGMRQRASLRMTQILAREGSVSDSGADAGADSKAGDQAGAGDGSKAGGDVKSAAGDKAEAEAKTKGEADSKAASETKAATKVESGTADAKTEVKK